MKLALVGDVALGDHPKSLGFGFASKYADRLPLDRAKYLFAEIEPDLVFGNLEYPLSAFLSGGRRRRPCVGRPDFARLIEAARFDVLNVANNHMTQYDRNVFWDTVDMLRKSGARVCGTRADINGDTIVRKGKETIAFIGVSKHRRLYEVDAPPYNEFDEEALVKDVERLADGGAVVCVSIHWGLEFIQCPSIEEQRIARRLVDAGATLIIGHHPHVIRRIEEYRHGLIAYSLGNFICDMVWNEATRESGCLVVTVSSSGIDRYEFKRARIDDEYWPVFLQHSEHGIREQKHDALRAREYFNDVDYERAARRAMAEHRLCTALHVLRNAHRYGMESWASMVRHSVSSRLPRAR